MRPTAHADTPIPVVLACVSQSQQGHNSLHTTLQHEQLQQGLCKVEKQIT
jgi:hypothetical protein